MLEEKIFFPSSDNVTLCGLFSEGQSKDVMVILCHGIRDNKTEAGSFNKVAKALIKKGLATLRFDFRGHGESTGNDYDVCVSKEIEDVESAINYATGLGYKHIIILGASFGGAIVSLVDYSKYANVEAIISWYGVTDFSVLKKGNLLSDSNRRIAENYGFYRSKSISTGEEFKFGLRLFEEIEEFEPFKGLSMSEIPVLFVHGTADKVVPCNYSVQCSKHLLNSRLELIEGGIHSFEGQTQQLEEAVEITIDYIQKAVPLLSR